jgi:hypothetical protein
MLSEMTHSAPTAFSDPQGMLLMGNNWAESAMEAAQKPISLSSKLRVSLTMQHTDAGLPLTREC